MGKWTSNWRVWRAEWTTPIYTRSQAPLARQEEGDEGKDEDVSGELSNCILPRAKPLLSASLTKSRRGRLLLPSVPKVSMCLRWCVDLWSRTLSTLPTACIYNSCLDIEEVARARPLANKPSTHLCRNKCITLLGLRQFLKWTVFLWAISWGPCPVWWSSLSTLADGGLEYKLSRVSPCALGKCGWFVTCHWAITGADTSKSHPIWPYITQWWRPQPCDERNVMHVWDKWRCGVLGATRARDATSVNAFRFD